MSTPRSRLSGSSSPHALCPQFDILGNGISFDTCSDEWKGFPSCTYCPTNAQPLIGHPKTLPTQWECSAIPPTLPTPPHASWHMVPSLINQNVLIIIVITSLGISMITCHTHSYPINIQRITAHPDSTMTQTPQFEPSTHALLDSKAVAFVELVQCMPEGAHTCGRPGTHITRDVASLIHTKCTPHVQHS